MNLIWGRIALRSFFYFCVKRVKCGVFSEVIILKLHQILLILF